MVKKTTLQTSSFFAPCHLDEDVTCVGHGLSLSERRVWEMETCQCGEHKKFDVDVCHQPWTMPA